MRLYVDGVGVWAAGLSDWPQTCAVLRGEQVYSAAITPLPVPAILHAAERRRAPTTVKLALHVANAACEMAQLAPAQLPCVFASSHGDTEISDYMCAELAQPQPALSPTKFHNSVHNAASGYWTIAVGCMQPANAISAGAHSFAAGLLEAAALASSDLDAVLLVAYDMSAPVALLPLCPIPTAFAVALVLTVTPSVRSLASLEPSTGDASSAPALPAFATQLMSANPAARSLPLLSALAQQQPVTVSLAQQSWQVSPWR